MLRNSSSHKFIIHVGASFSYESVLSVWQKLQKWLEFILRS